MNENVVVTFNGKRLLPRKPLRTCEASLETDEEGVMRPRVRKTTVSLFEAMPDEAPSLYEMGLPVVETGDKWHVNVGHTILGRGADVEHGDGYALRLDKGKLQLNLVKRWLDDALRVETKTALEPDHWHHVAVSYDGSRVAKGVRFYVNGQPVKHRVLLDELNQSFASKEPLRIGAGQGTRFRGAIGDVRVYDRVLSEEEALILATAADLAASAGTPQEKRSAGQAAKLRACFLDQSAPEVIKAIGRRLRELREERERLVESFPTTMVMEEMPTPRDTHLLIRGVYDKRGARVEPGVPAVFPPLPKEGKNDRLKLARWLVSPENPLTARVAVNRFWQMYFGEGLVKTPENFGVQGEPPSHPELLDWLATEFVRLDWDVKAMQRLIVTSATYRQSSQGSRDLYKSDPDNRLLARGPRHRLSAEMVRDQALFASGLLVEKAGGPSVKPYQPGGIEAARPVARAARRRRRVRPRRAHAGDVRLQLLTGPPPGRARRPLRAALPPRLGPAHAPTPTDRRPVPRHGPAVGGAAAGPPAAWPARRYARRLGRRVRADGVLPGEADGGGLRPRPPPALLHGLAGRGGNQARRDLWRDGRLCVQHRARPGPRPRPARDDPALPGHRPHETDVQVPGPALPANGRAG